MWIDLSPLKKYPTFRLLYLGQAVSFFGSMITRVSVPYQVYQLTRSTWMVGAISLVELVPLVISALIGGALADRGDRRRIALWMDFLSCFILLAFMINAHSSKPSLVLIFVLAAIFCGIYGIFRPSIEGMTPLLVGKEELPAVSALQSLRFSLGSIAGPALAGVILAHFGLVAAYAIDMLTYFISLVTLYMLSVPESPRNISKNVLASIGDGFTYVRKQQEIIGSYIVDIVAMVGGTAEALMPALSEHLGGPKVLGLLYAAPALGALLISLVSAWTNKVSQYGKAITYAALGFGISTIGFGCSHTLFLALFFLALSGLSDGISAMFRITLWNETIPNEVRGRMAGIEMISYMTGPLLGNAKAGILAALGGLTFSIVSGGVACVAGVAYAAWKFPKFWHFESTVEGRKPSAIP